MKALIKKMAKLPFKLLKRVVAPLMAFLKFGVAVWRRRNICVYLLAGRYCKIKEKTILWTAFDGRGILDNPRALFEAMLEDSDFSDWQHVWVLDGFKNHKDTLLQFKHCKRVRFVEFKSWRHMVILATAKAIVDNITCKLHFRKREGQIYINTWHGIPLKYLGNADRGLQPASKSSMIRNLVAADYICSASPFLSEVYKRDFMLGSLFNGEIIERGYPRLDTFKTSPREKVVALLKQYGVDIDPSRKVILYAPTWRGKTPSTADVAIKPLQTVKEYLERVIDCSQYQVLVKPHQIVYNAARKEFSNQHFMVPATIDANEILAITDVLISDFSSIFYDFLLTKRPIVFYIPDLEEYQASRGLYSSVDTLPGPIAQTLDELAETILHLDERIAPYKARYAERRAWAGCNFDQGDNSKRILHHIFANKPTTVVEKEAGKERVLFLLPSKLCVTSLQKLITFLNRLDAEKVDVTLLTDGNQSSILTYLSRVLPSFVRLLVRRGASRTPLDEIYWNFYTLCDGMVSLSPLRRYFEEEVTRYLGDNQFDILVDVSGKSLFYRALGTFIPAKKRLLCLLGEVDFRQTNVQQDLKHSSQFDACVTLVPTNIENLVSNLGTSQVDLIEQHFAASSLISSTVPLSRVWSFAFSIVMAVSNANACLKKAIRGVINQDIGFEEYVQLILVDDGSSDESGEICDQYAAQYPNNIVVIHQAQQGVAAARNAGLAQASGQFVNFLDPDDRLAENALSSVYLFAETYNDNANVIVLPVQFDAKKGDECPSAVKFQTGDRLINLLEEPEAIHTVCASVFFRLDTLGSVRFGNGILAGEESCFILQVLLKKPVMGVLSTPVCWCASRKHDKVWVREAKDEGQFFSFPFRFKESVLDMAVSLYGELPRFLQCVIAYHLRWMLTAITKYNGEITHSDSEHAQFIALMTFLCQHADVQMLQQTLGIKVMHLLMVLCKKYTQKPSFAQAKEGLAIMFGEHARVLLFDVLKWHSMHVEADDLLLYVAADLPIGLPEITNVVARCGADTFVARPLVMKENANFFDEPICCTHLYEIRIPLNQLPAKAKIELQLTCAGITYDVKCPCSHRRFPITDRLTSAYCIVRGRCLILADGALMITKSFSHWKKEIKLLIEILKKRDGRWKAHFVTRIICFLYKKLRLKPIWLLKDRSTDGGDNAEALFLYLRKHHPEVNAWFVIDKNTETWKRLKPLGHVVNFNTNQHRLLSALATVAISSQTESWFTAGEPKNLAIRDMIALRPFVFLQHGVTKDFVRWLGRYTQNLSGLVAAAKPETRAFLEEPYGYSKREVWETGFPRFDRLYHDEQKQITFMPTWRKWLFSDLNQETGVWTPRSGFTESAYFNFYNALLSNERLITVAQELDYTLTFFPHPMIRLNGLVNHFNLEAVQVLASETTYREIYAKSNLVVTDYSSAVFDFAYLRKPVVYAHFDKDEMFSGKHTLEKGYFDYERDGFGEVTYALEETVDCLIDYMKQGCQLKDKYRERIDKFFAFNDQNNCERVYQKICNLLEHSK